MRERKISIAILIFAILVTITPLLAYAATYIVNWEGKSYKSEIISVLPNKTDDNKLLRIIDREVGVVCYILQNDTADFYSGLQCIKLNPHHSIFKEERH